MNNDLLRKYAKLAVKTGVNIQKDDTLVINSPIETAEFARLITEEAYNLGAKDVVVHYADQQLTRIKLENSSVETISDIPEWFGESLLYTTILLFVYPIYFSSFLSLPCNCSSTSLSFSGIGSPRCAAFSRRLTPSLER